LQREITSILKSTTEIERNPMYGNRRGGDLTREMRQSEIPLLFIHADEKHTIRKFSEKFSGGELFSWERPDGKDRSVK
jgi:hypothetical protein